MSIVVPIHDAPLLTHRCLASLERYATQSEITLVDDGSRMAKTTQLIRDFTSRNGWKVVWHAEPRGHSAACAAGARLATCSYLCLLNSDTVVTPWCWRAIQQAFENDPSIGVAGPCTSFSWNAQTLDTARKCRFYWNDNQICGFGERLAATCLQPVVFDLPWVGGFAFFVRSSLWEKLGGFDQNLADYSNEVELCKRVSNSGYRTVWVRNAYIHHFGGQSYGLTPQEEASRVRSGFEYIRNRHNWLPAFSGFETKMARVRDGKDWPIRPSKD